MKYNEISQGTSQLQQKTYQFENAKTTFVETSLTTYSIYILPMCLFDGPEGI